MLLKPANRMNTSFAVSRPCSIVRPPGTIQGTLQGRCSWRTSSQKTSSLFNRTHELGKLDSSCKKQPSAILVVLGPRSCGKTASLKSYFEGKEHAVYIDCRSFDASTPASFVQALIKEVLPKAPSTAQKAMLGFLAAATNPSKVWEWNPSKVWEWTSALAAGLKVTQKMGGTTSEEVTISVSDVVRMLLGQRNGALSDLNTVIDSFRKLFMAWEENLPGAGIKDWPVLVIDEANVLMSWDDKHPSELAVLMRFFLLISKQDGRCHVVMATSEFGFQSWMNKAISSEFWTPVVIGDFPKDEARKFFVLRLQKVREQGQRGQRSSGIVDDVQGSNVTVDNMTWDKVYKVCGGNAGALVRLASWVDWEIDPINWDQALAKLWIVKAWRLRKLARGREGYTAVQYADAAIQLLDAKHHAVAEEDMLLQLGRHVVGPNAQKKEARAAGGHIVECMVEANALSVRPISDWAQDIPAEAFEHDEVVVTAPSALDLYCMGRMRPQLDETLEEWRQEQQGAAAAVTTGQTLHPPNPSSSLEVQAVQKEIEEVKIEIKGVQATIEALEAKIEALEETIEKAKAEGKQDEVQQLRAKEQQLWAEKQQLRAKEQQLRTKEQQLRAEKEQLRSKDERLG